MADKNKIEFGLSNLWFAPLARTTGTDGSVTYKYETPVRLQGVQSMTQEAQGETSNIYAEDMVWFTYTSNNGYSGELVFVTFTDDIREKIFKYVKTASGLLIERADTQPAEGALLYQCKGDQNNNRHILYDVTFGNPKVEYKTKEDGIEASVVTIPYTAVPIELASGEQITKGKCSEGDAAYADFFKSVTVPTIPTASGTNQEQGS